MLPLSWQGNHVVAHLVKGEPLPAQGLPGRQGEVAPLVVTHAHAWASLRPQEKEDPHSFFHTDTLIMTTHNLFFAGTETISTTLRYALLILMKFPEVAGEAEGVSP